MEELAEKLVKYMATHMEHESILLAPDPAVFMWEPYGLLDLMKESGIPAEQIDRWMVEAQES